jgi:hypothetical protein
MGDFDSIKIGVCDCWWTPNGASAEVYLGLTKGGVELTYTPEWHDVTVDQYGKTPVDEVLVGETLAIKVPLAETDLNKLKMFAHTGTWNADSGKLTFGQFPGMRLSSKAGKLRLHPIAFGTDTSEDVTVYRAVNKAPLQLAYKMDEERIFQCEFAGMIVRNNQNGSFLWEIGESTTSLSGGLKADLSNLESLFAATGDDFSISPAVLPDIYGTPDAGLSHNQSLALTLTAVYNFNAYDITTKATYTIGTPKLGGMDVVTTTGGATPAVVLTMAEDAITGLPTGVLTAVATATLTTFFVGSTPVAVGNTITIPVTVAWAGITHTLSLDIIV